jgi:DNA-binding transcriptional MocR family regulator
MWSESNRQGYLLIGDDNPSVSDLSMALSIPELDILRAVQELERRAVFSRTEEGLIYCPDMLKKVEAAKRYAQFGKKGGGNPSLKSKGYKGGYKPPFKPTFIPNADTASASATACIPPNPPCQGGVSESETKVSDDDAKPAATSGYWDEAKAAFGGQTR